MVVNQVLAQDPEKELALKVAAFWLEQGFAINWTAGKNDDGAKRCTKANWQNTPVLQGELAHVAGQVAERLRRANPVLVPRPSGLIVIETDGERELELFKSFSPPETAAVRSRPGRFHMIYRAPSREMQFAAFLFEDGTVTAKSNQYLVTPPAVHPDTGQPYEWLRTETETMPAELYDRLVTAARKERRNGATASPVADAILEGGRDSTLTSLAGTMRRRGMSEAELLAALKVTNAERCRPPLPDKDVERIARSVAKYPPVETLRRAPAAPEAGRIEWTTGDQVELKEIRFADKPIWQHAAFHLVTGRKNSGKGTMLASLAARVTRGELGSKRKVIWIASGEDSYGIDVVPRLLAAGGDEKLLIVVHKGRVRLPEDIDEIEQEARRRGDVGLIVFDPLGGGLAGGKSSNLDADVRPAIAPLNDLADTLDCMVVGVRHITNKRFEGDALAGVLGSSDWVNVPRCVIAITHDPEEDDVRHLHVVAGNRAKGGTGRKFRIEGRSVRSFKEEVTHAVWLGDSDQDPHELLSASKRNSNSGKARELILDLLDDVPHMESDELDSRVSSETGVASKTVKNLRSELGPRGIGLIRFFPSQELNAQGNPVCWYVARTNAPRPQVPV